MDLRARGTFTDHGCSVDSLIVRARQTRLFEPLIDAERRCAERARRDRRARTRGPGFARDANRRSTHTLFFMARALHWLMVAGAQAGGCRSTQRMESRVHNGRSLVASVEVV